MNKIKQKDYENARSERIENSEAWQKLQTRNWPSNHKNFTKLFQHNKEQFREWWGEQSCVWDSWVRNWIWRIPLERGFLFVISSTRGSSYEVSGDDFELVCEEAIVLLTDKFGLK